MRLHHLLFVGCLLVLCGASMSILVDEVRDSVISHVKVAWSQLKTLQRDGKSTAQVLQDLAQLLKTLPEQISRVERELRVYEYEEALKSLSKVRNTSDLWKEKWSEIAILTSPIDVLYGHFKIFPDMPEVFVPGAGILEFDANSLAELILKPLYNTDDKGTITLQYLLLNAHTSIVSRHQKDAFTLLADHIETALSQNNWCLLNGKTPQRTIYGFYASLLNLDIKEYTLLNFAWMLRYSLNNTDHTNDVQSATEILVRRAQEKAAVAKNAISNASPLFWKCDPKKYIEGENYEQFKELLQGYIENELKMHPTGSCKQSCSDYQFNKARCGYPDDESCFQHRVCTGNIVDCKFISADATVCNAEAPRRFDYIQYKRGPFLGNSSHCRGQTEIVNSHWRFLYHCSNCFCLCDDPRSPHTVRHVSLVPTTSNVAANKIVTGVKFVMKDKILHLQIEEGTPQKNGYVAEGTTDWKSVPTLHTRDENVMMLEYTNRSFDIDDIIVPSDYVVTGVRFRTLGSHLNLEVQATQINPLTAQLIPSSSHWISNDNTPEGDDSPRDELKFEEPDIPTLTKQPSIPDSVHDQYLEFRATSRYKDVAQTTIPFIDIQAVRPTPPVWLQGIGVYHKGRSGYGGFIAPRIFTLDISDILREE